jgi:cell division protein ZapA
MPQVEVSIGGRSFEVACQEGEEHYLFAAAEMLNTEASAMSGQLGRLPESRMLLMAGLMLADKTAGLEEKVRAADARMGELQAQIDMLQQRGAEQIEVPVIPREVIETMAELTARAEALADQVEAG